MSTEASQDNAGRQTPAGVGAAADAALHEQRYRYAQDLEVPLGDKSSLEKRFAALFESHRQLDEDRSLLENLVRSSNDIHLTTSVDGTILQCNAASRIIAPTTGLIGLSMRGLVSPFSQSDFDCLLTETLRSSDGNLDERELRLCRENEDDVSLIVAARLLPIVKDGSSFSMKTLMAANA